MGFSTAQGIMDALASPNIDPVDIAWEIDSDLRVRKPNAGEMRMRFTQEWVTPEVRWSIRRFYRLCRTRRAVENYLTYTRKEARRLAWEMFFTLGRSLMQRTWRPMRTQTEPIATVTPIRRYEQPNPHASWCTHCGKARWLHRETDGYACPAIGTAMDRWTPTGAAVARLTETEPAKPIEPQPMLLAAEPAAPVAPAPTLLMAEPAKPIPAPPMNDEKEEVDDWNDYRWANCYI